MSSGVLTKAAFRKASEEASWPTGAQTFPVATPSTGHLLPLLEEDMKFEPEHESFASLYAKAGKGAGHRIGKNFTGSVTLQGSYNHMDRLIGCAMGFENPNDSGATYHGSGENIEIIPDNLYAHIYELDDVLSEEDWQTGERLASGSGGGTWTTADDKVRFGHLYVLRKSGSCHCYSPTMVDKMVISANWNRVIARFDLVAGDHEIRNDYTSSGWTFINNTYSQAHLVMADAEFYLGTVDGTTLTWQEFGITEFELVLENNLEWERTTASGLYIPEPKRGDRRRVTGGFSFARYESDSIITPYLGNYPFKAWLKFSYLPSGWSVGDEHKFNIYLPSFYIRSGGVNASGPGVLKPRFTFECYKPSSDPFSADTDYSNINLIKTNEFWILTWNQKQYTVLDEEA